MRLEKFDGRLGFELPQDFDVIRETDDAGKAIYAVGKGKTVNDEGKTNYAFRMNIFAQPKEGQLTESEAAISLGGNIKNALRFIRMNQSFMGIELTVTTALIFLGHKETAYVMNAVSVGGSEHLEGLVTFINELLAAVVLDGKKGAFQQLTRQQVEKACDAAVAENMPYPVATPKDGQHTHWDFLERTRSSLGMFGGMIQINQSGAEYSFRELGDYFSEQMNDEPRLMGIINAPVPMFVLADIAREMGEIFRVNAEAFNEGEDREQEIENGLLRRCGMYEAFRSFAWTLSAWCEKTQKKPEQADPDTIREIAEFVVETRERLNYTEGSFCPVLCAGDDIHNYYIPDSVGEASRKALLEMLAEQTEEENYDPVAHVLSLDGLRKELTELYPVMQTIYADLAATRDFDTPLEGAVAEVLYVWCAITYAARTPFFTEDGPMNCGWVHPGKQAKLLQFGQKSVTAAPKKQPDSGYRFTYDRGQKFENGSYCLPIPDGFVIREGEEERDFIAYLPKASDPDDYLESDFIIFAGQNMNGQNNSQMKLPMVYTAVFSGAAAQFPSAQFWPYERSDLPGAVTVTIDPSCVHANAMLAYGETIKMIRFQITVSSKKQCEACRELIKSMLDTMTAKRPVKMLEQLDAPRYVEMELPSAALSEWVKLVDEYAGQAAFARNTRQNFLVQQLQSNNPGPEKAKKQVREMLRGQVEHAEVFLKKSDAIYQLKRAKYGNCSELTKMKKALDEAFLDLAEQYVNLDGQRLTETGDYLAVYKKHCEETADRAIGDILAAEDPVLSPGVFTALRVAKENYAAWQKAAAAREAERKAKAEEEKKRRQQEAEEKKRKKAYAAAVEEMNGGATSGELTCAAEAFALLGDYQDAPQLAAVCREKAVFLAQEEKNQAIYDEAMASADAIDKKELTCAAQKLETLGDWKDASGQARMLRQRIAAIEAEKERKRLEQMQREKRIKKTTILLLIAAGLILAFILVFKLVLQPSMQYTKAIKLLENGQQVAAADLLVELGGYKDAKERLETLCAENPTMRFYIAKVGDKVTLGTYDHGDAVREISWYVLGRDGNHVLLVSEYILDGQRYHDEAMSKDWAQCDLYSWLQSDFAQKAFSPEEQAYTEVFLPDRDELQGYLNTLTQTEKERIMITEPTGYALDKGMKPHIWYNGVNHGYAWWLGGGVKSYTGGSKLAPIAYADDAYVSNNSADCRDIEGVRPFVWITVS